MHKGGALRLHDDKPRRKHPLALSAPGTASVNRELLLSDRARVYYNQNLSTCVPQSCLQIMTFYNGKLYHPGWLYARGQELDPFPPGTAGVATDAVLNVMRDRGNVIVDPAPERAPEDDPPGASPSLDEGITTYKWLAADGDAALEEARALIAMGIPFVFSADFGSYWHQFAIFGAFDDGEYFLSPNTSGLIDKTKITYARFVQMVNEGAYGAAVTDRVPATTPPKKKRKHKRKKHKPRPRRRNR